MASGGLNTNTNRYIGPPGGRGPPRRGGGWRQTRQDGGQRPEASLIRWRPEGLPNYGDSKLAFLNFDIVSLFSWTSFLFCIKMKSIVSYIKV